MKSQKLKYFSVALVLATLSFVLLSIEKNSKINDYLSQKYTKTKQNYNTIYAYHKKITNLIYKTHINKSDILHTMQQANIATLSEKKELREILYKKLIGTYSLLKDNNIKQLHFHLKNNESFLRFHRLEKYGDNLTGIRETVEYVNKHKKPIDGFEEGRIYNGYRFVYPLFFEKEHVGSVEVSFSTLAMSSEYFNRSKQTTGFFIQKDVVDKKVFSNEKHNYSKSLFKDFYVETSVQKSIMDDKHLTLDKYLSSEIIDSVNNKHKDNTELVFYSSEFEKIISFIKVYNPITKKQVGLFGVLCDGAYVKHKMNNYYFILFIIGLFFMSIFLFLYKGNIYKKKIELSNEELYAAKKESDILIKEQQALLSLFNMGDSVLFKWNNDENWSVKYVSDSVEKLLEYKKSEFENLSVAYSNCIHQDDLQKVVEEVRSASKSKDLFFKHEPYRIITKSGKIKWILDYTVIERDADGVILNYIGYINDISKEYETQEELKILNQTLQERIKEEVDKNRQRDQKVLEQSRLAQMGEMISMIAHQWRQPLGAISSTSIDLSMNLALETFNLKDEKERDECQTYINHGLKEIDSFVQNLSSTIDDFRNFHKPDKEADFILAIEPVKRALKIMKASLASDGIEVIELCSSCHKEVEIFSNEMMQVILNIIKNSQDNFKEKGIKNPKITISCGCGIIDKNMFALEISDNGGGIPEDILPHIFDPYYSTKSEKNGTGLGLYMSKTIVEDHHNGSLIAKNADDGVCFIIELNEKIEQ